MIDLAADDFVAAFAIEGQPARGRITRLGAAKRWRKRRRQAVY
ncbi:MAG: hypothetical protein ACR2F8_12160 [Caulobacteraceae bacterium]